MIKSLEITSRIGCPLKCESWCPQDKILAAHKGPRETTLEMFDACLAKVPKDVRIDGSGFSELLIIKDAAQIMAHAKMKGHETHLYTTLVGLDQQKMYTLMTHRPNYVRIHVPDTKFLIVPDEQWIRLCAMWLTSEIPSTWMTMGEMTLAVKMFLHAKGITVETPSKINRAGNLDYVDAGRPITGPVTCGAERYFQNVLLPGGDVVGCCCDYSKQIKLGNLLTEDYATIHNRAIAWSRDIMPPQDSPCRQCTWAKPA